MFTFKYFMNPGNKKLKPGVHVRCNLKEKYGIYRIVYIVIKFSNICHRNFGGDIYEKY